jgi:hypothetical protein
MDGSLMAQGSTEARRGVYPKDTDNQTKQECEHS